MQASAPILCRKLDARAALRDSVPCNMCQLRHRACRLRRHELIVAACAATTVTSHQRASLVQQLVLEVIATFAHHTA